eukprot:GEMP01018376.1.p1 GENE.GEMP01018376.1~~GEMP01018376.1.p1  ORF type:complete len:856 (+),score=169.12 GEMP01018376.1:24-2591(+)
MGWGLRLASSDSSLSSQQVLHASCANRCLLLALSNSEVVRVVDDDVQVIRFATPDGRRPAKIRASKVFQDPNGFHGIIAMENGDNWYVGLSNCQALALKQLKGYLVEAVAWEENTKESVPPQSILMGTTTGQILRISPQNVANLLVMPEKATVVDLVFRQSRSGVALLVTTAHQMFFFAGAQWDDLLRASDRQALVFDVPRGTHPGTGGLQIDWEARQGAWLTGAGTLLFKINDQGRPGKDAPTVVPFTNVVEEYSISSVLAPPSEELPKSLAVTVHHILLLLPELIHVISRITYQLVAKIPVHHARYGLAKRLVQDAVGERIYLVTDQRIYEVFCENEMANVWSLYLERQQFDEALRLAPPESQDVVRTTHAEHLCNQGDYLQAARIFAQADGCFETACLRLMERPNNERALLEYLCERMEQRGDEERAGSDTIPDVMLCLWGIDLSLQLPEDPDTFLDNFLRKATRLDIVNSVYQLLRSYGRITELLWFAEQISDFTTVLEHYVYKRDFNAAIAQLQKHNDTAGLHKYFPLLFYHEPHQVVSVLVKRPVGDLDVIIPAVCLTQLTPTHKAEAIRYLEYCHRVSASTAACNALTWMYSTEPEDHLMKFLQANENNESLDPAFALRVCHQQGNLRAEVLLYGFMGLYEQAVALSLERGDLSLAKYNASKPREPEVRRKLWLDVVEYLAKKKCAAEEIVALSKESQLDIKDMLPYLSDEMPVSVFRDDIVKCMEQYEKIIELRSQEIMDHRRAATLLKQDLADAAQAHIVVPGDAVCDLCCRLATREVFVAFFCGHCIHAMCGSNLGLLLDDCPLCGNIMQEAITKPFWKLPDDEKEKEKWEIESRLFADPRLCAT